MTNFDQWLARKLEDPEFREAYDTLHGEWPSAEETVPQGQEA